MLTAILSFIVVLGSLIIVHEFGHFLVAKWSGVGVLKFSVGFGPTLFGRTVNGTEYVLSAIPLGGFVKMVGEDPDAAEAVDPRISFSHQNVWKRIAIVMAGPVFNLIFAFLIFSVVQGIYGQRVPVLEARIGGITADMPAAKAGLQANDLVLAADGTTVNWEQLSAAIRGSEGHPVGLDVRRGDEVLHVTVTPEARPDKSIFGEAIGTTYLIGIERGFDVVSVGPLEAIANGAEQTVWWCRTLIMSVVKIVQGRIPAQEIGGPILIAQAAGQQAQIGLESLLLFIAVISINLGVLNLLPIPILDGGHLLFFVLEIVMRRPLDMRHREIAQQVGLVILISLMAFAFYNDILRVIRGVGLNAGVRALGVDTATGIASVGLVTDSAAVVRRRVIAGSHARTLLPLIDEVLQDAGVDLPAIDLLAVSIGPGSFTGLRVGLAVVKGLAMAAGTPVIGVPTLEAYARALGPRPGAVWPVLDARKGEVYAAGYRWRDGELEEIAAPAAMSPATLAGRLEGPCTMVGDGVDAYAETWSAIAGVSGLRLADCPPDGAVVARLGASLLARNGGDDLAALEPRYCRRPEAERHRDGIGVAAVSSG